MLAGDFCEGNGEFSDLANEHPAKLTNTTMENYC